jgi:PAS domain-containing protein
MKSFFYRSIVFYFLIILILALLSHYYIINFISANNQLLYCLYICIIFIICSPIAFVIIFRINDKKNNDSITNLKRINKDLYESNERYDIVAKATSDTIWDWDIKTGGFIWNKGIQGVFGYKKEDVGENLQWWFEKIHPEDSLKMSVKLYSFIEQKTEKWQDYYTITNTNIIDAAVYWKKNGYIRNTLMCLSFQYKKHLSLGRGGMILTDNKETAMQLKKMSYDGRLPNIPWAEQNVDMMGYHYYMTPENADIGIDKFKTASITEPKQWSYLNYPDLSMMKVFNEV